MHIKSLYFLLHFFSLWKPFFESWTIDVHLHFYAIASWPLLVKMMSNIYLYSFLSHDFHRKIYGAPEMTLFLLKFPPHKTLVWEVVLCSWRMKITQLRADKWCLQYTCMTVYVITPFSKKSETKSMQSDYLV